MNPWKAIVLPLALATASTSAQSVWTYVDEQTWQRSDGTAEDLRADRKACIGKVEHGLGQENFEDALFRLTEAELNLRAWVWAEETFGECMQTHGWEPSPVQSQSRVGHFGDAS